jgi:hypothetical protein
MRGKVLLIILVATLLAIGVTVMPILGGGSNCGGNTAAFSVVKHYVQLAISETITAPESTFSVTNPTPDQREMLERVASGSWIPRAHFLVSSAPFQATSKERRVIIVCDKSFTNVPKRSFGTSPPTHAAGFSDGTTGLISPAEFSQLNRSSFARLDELFPSKHE